MSCTDAHGCILRYVLDGGATSTVLCTSNCTSSPWPFELLQLQEGTHTVVVFGVDDAENMGNETHSWMVDVTPPSRTIIVQRPAVLSGEMSANFSFDCTDSSLPCRYKYSLNSGVWQSTDRSAHFLLTTSQNSLSVRAVDAVGNMDPIGTNYSWVIVLNPPTTIMNSESKPALLSASAVAQFSFSCSNGPGQCAFRYLLDSSADWLKFGLAAWKGAVEDTTINVVPALSTEGPAVTGQLHTIVSPSRGFLFELSAPIQVAVPFEYRALGGSEFSDWLTLDVGKTFVTLTAPKDGNYTFQVNRYINMIIYFKHKQVNLTFKIYL